MTHFDPDMTSLLSNLINQFDKANFLSSCTLCYSQPNGKWFLVVFHVKSNHQPYVFTIHNLGDMFSRHMPESIRTYFKCHLSPMLLPYKNPYHAFCSCGRTPTVNLWYLNICSHLFDHSNISALRTELYKHSNVSTLPCCWSHSLSS